MSRRSIPALPLPASSFYGVTIPDSLGIRSFFRNPVLRGQAEFVIDGGENCNCGATAPERTA